jgi:ADP-heptose:LPS heptosyltransferase
MAGFAAQAIAAGKKIVCLNPGGGWYTKRWGLQRFAELGDRLIDQLGVAILLAWGPGEERDVHDVASRMKHPVVIPPPTSLLELAALLRRCALMITNDSGPMHLATAVGTPVIGIYGPTNPVLQGPYGSQNVVVRREGLSCLGCNRTTCDIGLLCMAELGVTPVAEQAQRILSRQR